ncbi:hypothetical protein [Streptomyces sp. MP131-18]|uniref:hypothetical protein n=1 Tax=Streptomyces sp. MP131-18 TaxID=1857892 RepID=UPI0009CE3750|nr:hypothetical protein [Streptomyces sp. MP131-18]ONK15787.1 hypothetical protein STBA_66280 [Streptomyces sp. MP131-18]
MTTDGTAPPAGRDGTAAVRPVPEALAGTPPEPAVELMVHGVGGTTPEKMLEDARTTRVTGDATASVYRRTEDLADRPWGDTGPVREAYIWCNLTSGNGARALWLLLLPFTIVNLAHWMRPAAPGPRRTDRLYDTLVRLTALSLTVLLAAGACAVSLDLLAWQCAASAACAEGTSWIEPFGPGHGWWAQPGRRLALAAVVPLALIALLWWLSHRTWSAYESASPPVRPRPDGGDHARLSLPGFWYGRALVARLRATHVTVALLTVAAALLTATGPYDRGGQGSTPLAVCGWLLLAATVAGGCVVAVQQARHGRTEEEPDDRPEPSVTRTLPRAAMVLLLLVVVHTGWSRPDWAATGRHPAGSAVFPALTLVQGALVVAVALAAHRLHRQARSADRGALGGLGGACVAMLACGLGGVLTGGVAQHLADWLDPSAAPGEPGAAIAGPPVLLSWEASVIPLLLVVVLGLAVAALLHARRSKKRLAASVRDQYPDESCEPLRERSDRIASAVARASLTDHAPVLVGWISGACLVFGLTAVAGSLTGDSPSQAAADSPAVLSFTADACQALGSWLMGIGVVLLLAMGRRAYRDTASRRTIGILWDIGTFWPRAAHPFAPPCYAERAVPDLSWRMGTWVDSTGGRLIISGHSQGSVLAAAAVWQLDAATRSRIALLTHGSPLARLYGPWFPAFFGPQALDALHRDMPRWRNLWRATDPIGGPAGGGDPPVDRGPLPDPMHYGRNLQRPLPEPILGHGDYEEDPAFIQERAELFRALGHAPLAVPAQQGQAAEQQGP